jgi:glucose/arabinose dehydrogenase
MSHPLNAWSKLKDKKFLLVIFGACITVCPSLVSAGPDIQLEPIISDLDSPVAITHAGDGTGRLFITLQVGKILVYNGQQLLPTPFLDIGSLISTGGELGLLGLAFHPNYSANGFLYVDYTDLNGDTVIARYRVSADPNVVNTTSAVILLTIPQPFSNHNGGQLQFGPDGYLYIGMGDGGGAGDQHGQIGNGQDPQALLGKMLRIDVTNQDTYAVPASNPSGNEIWASGVRNPWRFSFDRSTGDLYMADVGQNTYEEVNFQPASSTGGENYGWRIMEGTHCFDLRQGCDQSGLALPVAEYSHDAGGCSVTGGYVYRGSKYPALQGAYFFGDYCTGNIWSLQRSGDQWQMTRRLESGVRISSFGEDVNGELYVVDHGGAIYQLAAR